MDTKALHDLLFSCEQALAYFEERMDVRDGSDGKQLPNEEMCLAADLRAAMDRARAA